MKRTVTEMNRDLALEVFAQFDSGDIDAAIALLHPSASRTA